MELIGQGGVWKVYKLRNQNNVFRIPKGFAESSINTFIKNHEIINKLGLPTLQKVEESEINGMKGIICEDINNSEEKIYVTYNSLYSDSQKNLHSLSKDIIKNKEERQSSLAEDFRYKNKIVEIIDFENFIIDVKIDLKNATNRDVLIDFDSYFFGTQKQKIATTIDYKIIDLDHIYTNTKKKKDELYDLNLSEFSRALNGFIRYFVTETSQSKYMDYLL
ncbi:hypothetical protein [Flavobacterium sp. 2]|uniref:hypothetical protein n=1 Tax=Flavobacterium sp. 2 TaxID=308053 RepID=UPI000C17936D|nr:hypothetical protein [Flavobacterium sp. 2]PIF69452.1 hypothetical protein CLU99_0157 [Flavobacterium sp. 2]